MSLKGRIERIEGGMPGPRCSDCKDWPPTRVVYLNDWQDEPREPATPERCSRCGFEPITVVVEYVESWPPNAVA